MTGMLASVNSLEEALLVQQAKVDIIDLKQPQYGALGALKPETVKEIVTAVKAVNPQTPLSATIGDLPMQSEMIFQAVQTMAATGVDYVKIGFFPEGDSLETIKKLTFLTGQGLSLIAVLFADMPLDFAIIQTLKNAGFKGVMLDTMNKKNGSLTQVMPLSEIKNFVALAHEQQLLCGLAGSLCNEDVASLLPLQADYLGFRGALCQKHDRVGELDLAAIHTIREAIS